MNLRDLLKAGLLQPGEELVWSRRVMKTAHTAVISKDGLLTTTD